MLTLTLSSKPFFNLTGVTAYVTGGPGRRACCTQYKVGGEVPRVGTPVHGWNAPGEDNERGVRQREVGHGEHPGTAWRDGATGTYVSMVTVIIVISGWQYVNA